jgi:hypothetical protein
MKKTDFRTKRKAQREANTQEADQLIEDYLAAAHHRNDKTKEILEEYIEEKDAQLQRD